MTLENCQWKKPGYKFWIPECNNFSSEAYTTTFETHVVPILRYSYCIVFDQYTLFMLLYYQSWAASKGIKLKSCSEYHLQTIYHSEIVNKEIM